MIKLHLWPKICTNSNSVEVFKEKHYLEEVVYTAEEHGFLFVHRPLKNISMNNFFGGGGRDEVATAC
jgi:hypothetical protein